MDDKFSNFTSEVDEELSVTSPDPHERKLARRLRVQKRLEALAKRRGPEAEEIEERAFVEKQILDSSELLEKLLEEGNEVVSCVKLANDARELQRRTEEQELRRTLLKKLEEDDKECMRKYKEVNEKWSSILVSKDPLDIHAAIEAQNARCMEIIARKDAVIEELQEELENADFKFLNDQKIQNKDIDSLIDRVDKEINVMTKACHRELLLIDDVIESERKALLENVKEKWEALYRKLQEENLSGLDRRKEIMHVHDEEIKKVMIEHQEEFRAQKIHLELEIQKLQQELQNMKALCFMNIEKLDYSYTVLKRREDENTIVQNLQKRRISKLQDVMTALKKEYAQLEEKTRFEIQKLTDQIVKIHKNILELMEKSNRFMIINDKKYMQIWNMNTKNANQLLCKILNMDKIIYEQALYLEWNPPEKTLFKKEDLPSYHSVVKAIEEENRLAAERRIISKYHKPAETIEEINLERRLLNHILKHVAGQCEYLLEDKLLELLLPYTTNDQLIVRLDNVFQALNIKSEKELDYLLNFFLPYAYCPICTKDISRPNSVKSIKSPSPESSVEQLDVCEAPEFTVDEIKLITTVKEAIYDEKLSTRNDVSISAKSSSRSSEILPPIAECTPTSSPTSTSDIIKDDDQMQRRLLCDKGHLLEIEAMFVTRALREFVERYHFVKLEDIPQTFQERLIEKKKIISRNMTIEDVTKYWMQYSEIFPATRERLWDGLLIGLKKYHDLLKERDSLNIEIESLQKQNEELHHLLKTYMMQPEFRGLLQDDEQSVCETIIDFK